MKIRSLALAGVLGVSILVAGCATSIAGQAEVAGGAVAPGSSAGPSAGGANPEQSGADGSATEQAGTGNAQPQESDGPPTTSPGADDSTTSEQAPTQGDTSEPSTTASDESVGPTSIPGLSADCNKVLAAITAFSSILEGGSAGDINAKISQATVDEALKQLPASGLPARPQADITILRATVSAAAGKTVAELGMSMADGKVVGAIQDLSSWTSSTCA